MSAMITIEHLRKEFPLATPLKDVNTQIEKGEIISVIGPSGTGKSTLLRCINLLEKPTSGKIYVDGEDITAKDCKEHLVRRKMGMVFQSFNLFPHMTVIENIMFAPVRLLGKSRQEAYDRGLELLRQVGLADRAFRYPDELSGGQKQRVAIARTLAMEPEIILFDEPTSALDPTMVGEVLTVIRELAGQGLTMLIVTHEMKFARDVSTRVFYMDQGEIYEDGTPEQIFEHPQRDLTRRFVQRLKVFEKTLRSKDFDFIGLNTELEEFGRRNLMNQRTIVKVQSVIEELCVQTLIPQAETVDILVSLEYSDVSGEATLRLSYNGGFDAMERCGELSEKIIRHTAESIRHIPLTDGDYSDMTEITMK